jgi:hypothetical protein
MADQGQFDESDPRQHTIKLKDMLTDVAQHAREDVGKVEDPQGRALFETTAEVCGALVTTLQHYEEGSEPAWRS